MDYQYFLDEDRMVCRSPDGRAGELLRPGGDWVRWPLPHVLRPVDAADAVQAAARYVRGEVDLEGPNVGAARPYDWEDDDG